MGLVSTQGQLPLMLPVDILLSSSLLWYPSLSHSPIGIYFWWSSGRTLIYKLGLWIKGHQLRTRCWNHIRRVCRTGFPVALQLPLRTEPLFVDEPSFKWKKCTYPLLFPKRAAINHTHLSRSINRSLTRWESPQGDTLRALVPCVLTISGLSDKNIVTTTAAITHH